MTRRDIPTEEGPHGDLLRAILAAPDRDPMPFAHPVVSWTDRDEDAYLEAIEACALASIRLERRGREHGDWAELDPARCPIRPGLPARGTRAFQTLCAERWHAARPIVLRDIAGELLDAFADEIAEAGGTHESLCERGGLAAWFAERAGLVAPDFEARADRVKLADPERDIERVALQASPPPGASAAARNLWCKSAWLSTHPEDRSVRLRFGHGKEGVDDGDRHILDHRLVAELAARLLPETAVATANPALVQLVEKLSGEPVLFTQALAYWNAPGGGALFHHDAFAEDAADDGSFRQLGVCYVQLSGATAWLAISTEDLMARIREFAEALEDGQLPWVRAQIFESKACPFPGGWKRFTALIGDSDALRRELARPGCGSLGPLVDRGPEFTAFLADAGHGAVLRPGDAILLPNSGLEKTCMHSVFCAGDEVAYSISLAMRPDREAPQVRAALDARRRERFEEKRAVRAAAPRSPTARKRSPKR
ncbi:MAG: hypothetical protein NTY35_08610 [Planctomycetota bacterium]|nr:hypothetical protein [Planctomycetota bacterium]